MINKHDFKMLMNFIYGAILLFGTHILLIHFFHRYLFVPNILFVHPFLFIVSIASIITVRIVFSRSKLSSLANAYMATSLGKMLLSLLFLLPQILNNGFYQKEYVLQFFVIYFVYLIVEVVYLVKHYKNR